MILFSCSSSVNLPEVSESSRNEVNPLNKEILQDSDKNPVQFSEKNQLDFNEINKKIDSLLLENNKQNQLMNEYVSSLNQKVFLFDSLYKKTVIDIQSLEDNINIISKSYNEISKLNVESKVTEIPPLSDKEFQEKYIQCLAAYQNGDMEKSLTGFKYLLTIKSSYELLDNCQYWVGEIYFKMKEYHNSIIEFEKVLGYNNSNKHDDALYKLSKCYIHLNNEDQADYELNKLVNSYPNSEYVRKAKLILNN